MVCTQPAMPHGLAEAITNGILAWLHETHHIGSGNGLDVPNGQFEFRDEHKQKLLDVVRDLVMDDICQSF